MKHSLFLLRQALAFFTILPVSPAGLTHGQPKLAEFAWAVPVVGLIVGGICGLGLIGLTVCGFHPLLATVLVLGAQTSLTRGLHEDGLADCADAFGGGWTREARLSILKDSRIGTFGTLSLIMSSLIKVTALYLISLHGPLFGALALISSSTLSRFAMLAHAAGLPMARQEGLAVSSGAISVSNLRGALIITVIILVCLGLFGLPAHLLLLACGLSFVLTAFARWQIRKRLGGVTGDGFGYTQQINEIGILAILSF